MGGVDEDRLIAYAGKRLYGFHGGICAFDRNHRQSDFSALFKTAGICSRA
jgi:hypothetical protein